MWQLAARLVIATFSYAYKSCVNTRYDLLIDATDTLFLIIFFAFCCISACICKNGILHNHLMAYALLEGLSCDIAIIGLRVNAKLCVNQEY